MASKRLAPRRRPKTTLHNPELGIMSNCYRNPWFDSPLEPWFDKTWRPGKIEIEP